jgi:hypothetical protein
MTLPGMPLAVGDPGLFICKIDDGAPPAVRKAANAGVGFAQVQSSGWLVAELCPACSPRAYCREHNSTNWWLTHWGR